MKFYIEADNHTSKQSNEQDGPFSLINIALSVAAQGHAVIPVSGKGPNMALMPRDPRKPLNRYGQHGKSSNLFIEQNQQPTVQQVETWVTHPNTTGLGLLTGLITVLEFDDKGVFNKWLACDGVRDIVESYQLPDALSGSGRGYHVPFIVDGVPDGVVISTKILAWIRNEEKVEGRSTAIEVKGFKSAVKMSRDYVLLPNSSHASGGFYQELGTFGGSYADIPRIPYQAWLTMRNAALSVCEAPKSKATLEREARNRIYQAQKASQPKREYSRSDAQSPIDRFNDENDVEEMLSRYGDYTRQSFGNWSYGSKGKSTIHVWNNGQKSSHHHPNDPLHEGNSGKRAHSAFDIYCYFEHDGRIREAVKELAEEYRIDYATMYQEERASRQKQPAPQQQPKPAQHEPPPPDFGPPPPDFGPPPPDFDEYEPDEPSYDDLLASCGVPVAPNTVTPNPQAREFVAYQRMETAYDRFDWNAYKAQVASHFDLARYKEENGITDHKGGVFKSVCFVEFGHDQVKKHWGKVLRAAAAFAGVAWPDFRRLGWTLDDTLDYAKRVASNFSEIELQQHGEYLSDVFDYNCLPYGVVTHTIAGCGIGKTRAADNVSPKSFYCPMSRQAETFTQSANGRGSTAEVVIEGYEHGGEDVIFGTYDAARKEIQQLSDPDKPFSLAGRTQFIDEIQHVSHDAYRRSTALEPLIEASKLYLSGGGRVITLSGTPSPLLPAPLSFHGSNVILVKRANEATRKLFIFRQSDPVEAILNLIKQGYTHISYSIDDKARCEMICEALRKQGVTACAIHSENKTSTHHRAYVGENGQDGLWDEAIQVYLTTRATVDGFSVMIQSSEAVRLAEMFDQSLQYGSGNIEQRSRRVRNHPADVYVGFCDKSLEQLGKGGHFDLAQERNDEFRLAEIMLGSAKALQLEKARQIERNEFVLGLADEIEDANKQASLYTQEVFKGWVRINEAGELAIDDFAIEQRITRRWVAKAHGTPDIMINELCSFGLEYQGLVNLTGNKEDANERIDYEKEVKKAKKQAKLTEIKAQAEAMSDTQAQIVLQNASKIIKDEGDIGKAKVAAASLRRDLVKQGLTLPAAKAKIQTLTSLRSDVIKRVESVIRQAKIRRAMTDSQFVRRADKITRFYATLQDGQTFKIGDVLQSSEIKERVVTAAAACGVPAILTPYTIQEKRRYKKAKQKPDERHDSDKKILKLIRDMFLLERTNKKINGVKQNHYEILGFNKVELAPFVPTQPIETKPDAEPVTQTSDANPLDLLQDGLNEGYISRDISEHLTRLYQNGWLTNADFIQTLEELKASFEPNW